MVDREPLPDGLGGRTGGESDVSVTGFVAAEPLRGRGVGVDSMLWRLMVEGESAVLLGLGTGCVPTGFLC